MQAAYSLGSTVVTGLASFDEALQDSDVFKAVEEPSTSFDEEMDFDTVQDFQKVLLIEINLVFSSIFSLYCPPLLEGNSGKVIIQCIFSGVLH